MEITAIRIRKTFDGEPLKAIASVTLDDTVAIHDVKIIHAKDRYFAVMPSKKSADGSYRDIVHPINAGFRKLLEDKLIKEYLENKQQSETEV